MHAYDFIIKIYYYDSNSHYINLVIRSLVQQTYYSVKLINIYFKVTDYFI